MNNETALALLNKRLGNYCLTQCPAKCCRIGKLLVSEKFVKEFNVPAIKRDDGCYDLKIEGGCPLLKDNKCSIHKNPSRPRICGEYPFFNRNGRVLIASSCKAVEAGLFTETLKELDKKNVNWEIQ